jgi:hypothetical protein
MTTKLDCTSYASTLIETFNEVPGTDVVEVRCSLPIDMLEIGILDIIKNNVDELIIEHNLKVIQVTFTEGSDSDTEKDFFLKATVIPNS